MVQVRRFSAALLGTFAFLVVVACAPRAVVVPPDKDGCVPSAQFVKNGVDLSVGANTIGKVATGALTLKTNPEVQGLLSQVASDAQAIAYVACRNQRVNGYTPEQAQHQVRFLSFFRSSPTADQVVAYLKADPPPGIAVTPGSVTVTIPADQSLREVLNYLAATDRQVVRFAAECSSELLASKVMARSLTAPSTRELMVNVGLALADSKQTKLSVTADAGSYLVSCGL